MLVSKEQVACSAVMCGAVITNASCACCCGCAGLLCCRRGYRSDSAVHKAALNEAAAAGLMLLAGWQDTCKQEGKLAAGSDGSTGTARLNCYLPAKAWSQEGVDKACGSQQSWEQYMWKLSLVQPAVHGTLWADSGTVCGVPPAPAGSQHVWPVCRLQAWCVLTPCVVAAPC